MKNLAKFFGAAVVALGGVLYQVAEASSPSDFKARVEISLNTALADTEITTGVPALVRLSEATISGFDYDDFSLANGGDMMFTDADGNELPFEIDTWDPSGESLVWVKLPSTAANTVIKMYYGNGATPSAASTSVWSGYVGVWHLNDTNATETTYSNGEYPNSTATAGLSGNLASYSIANETGKFGKSFRVNDVTTARSGNYNYGGVWVPGVDALKLGNTFTISGWFKNAASTFWYDHLFFKRGTTDTGSAFAIQVDGKDTTDFILGARGVNSTRTALTVPDSISPFGNWVYLTFVYNGAACNVYANGAAVGTSAISAVTDNTDALVFGNCSKVASGETGDCAWSGWIDECRVMDDVPDANAVAAEYAAQNVGATDIFTYGTVAPAAENAVKFVAAPTLTPTADGLRVSVTLAGDSHAGAVYAICGTATPYAYRSVLAENAQAGDTVSGVITNLPVDAVCGFGVLGVSSADATETTLSGVGTFCSGAIAIAKGADASEQYPSVPGTFTVSRPAGATDGDLVVNYTASGSAVAGTHYQALSGSITIPDGETAATIEVYPIVSRTADHTLTLTITNGFYATSTGSASITIKKFDPTTGFEKKVEFTVSGYAGATLTNFPVLVKISESAIEDFSYDDCQLENGGDIRFIDESYNCLSSEVEVWNEEGESLIWVKVPSFSSSTRLTMLYGNDDPTAMTPADTWSDYAGVYHFNEVDAGAQTVKDSSGNSDGTSHSKSLVMDGVFGKARGRTDATGKNGATMTAPISTALDNLTPTFTVSGWMYPTTTSAAWEYVFSRKNADAYKSWGWQFRSDGNLNSVGIYSSGKSDDNNNRNVFSTSGKFAANTWVKYNVVYTSTQVSLYVNGALVETQTIKPTGGAVNGSLPFAVGGLNGSGHGTMRGYFDETRLRYGAVDADWIAAEYAFEHGSVTFDNSGATPVDATSVKFDGKPVVTKDGDSFKLSVTTASDSGIGTIRANYGTNGSYDLVDVMTTAAAASTAYEVALSHLADDTSYKARAEGENAKGTISKLSADNTFYNGTLAIAKGVDADENELSLPATVIVSRADTYGDLVVNYAIGGTGVAGVNYVEIPNSITITNGASSATIEIYPLKANTADHTVEITLADGLYFVDGSAKSATVTIVKLHAPDGYNTWIATEDGNASVAANWSLGRVPNSTDHILVDGRFSTASMTWDAGENGLPSSVASWTQSEDYTGTVTMNTVYPGKGDFQTFTVTGALTINGGVWTHPQSRTTWDWVADYVADLKANETYRIKVACGSLVVGANARIDTTNKGYYQANTGSVTLNAPVHGGMFASSTMSPYGDPKEPTHIGLGAKPASGAYTVGIGGGAIYIVVDGAATVNGVIKADTGSDPWSRGLTLRGGAAAGSVYLKAASVSGSGTISASARSTDEQNGRGCGGRVAVIATGSAIDRSTLTLAATVYPYKSGTSESSSYGSCGTVYVKDTTTGSNGLLIIDNQTSMPNWSMGRAVTIPSSDGDGTFDKLALGHKAILALPVGMALHLPNGLVSVSSLNDASSTEYGSIRYEGGTLDIGSATDQTMSGSWMLTGNSNLVLNCNLTVQNGSAIGIPAYGDIIDESATLPEYPICRVSVIGNLDVASTAGIYARSCGLKKYKNTFSSGAKGVLPGHSHGGRCMAYAGNVKNYQAYDSVFAPCLPGNAVPYPNGQSAEASGGVLKLTVTGTFTLDGVVNANGLLETYKDGGNCSGGTGGSIDITAGQLKGSGSILAEGGAKQAVRGPGGRIAVKLSVDNADFSGFTGKISASGRVRTGNYLDSSAGTVYLQTAADGDKCGTIRIAMSSGNRNLNNTNTTEMVSLGYGGDAIEDYKKVNYVVSDYGRAAVNTDFQSKSVKLATIDAFLDLEGNDLTVSKFQYAVTDGETTSIKKLSAGTYSITPSDGQLAFPADCSNVYDTVAGGTLTVKPYGIKFTVR